MIDRRTEPFLLTPGPLTTSITTKQAMLRDWGSRDPAFMLKRSWMVAVLAVAVTALLTVPAFAQKQTVVVYTAIENEQVTEYMGATVSVVLLIPALLAFVVDRLVQRRQYALVTASSRPLIPTRAALTDGLATVYCGFIALVIGGIYVVILIASLVHRWPYNMGVLGWLLRKLDFETAPIVLGLVLAPMTAGGEGLGGPGRRSLGGRRPRRLGWRLTPRQDQEKKRYERPENGSPHLSSPPPPCRFPARS